jgi:hypothetical protein
MKITDISRNDRFVLRVNDHDREVKVLSIVAETGGDTYINYSTSGGAPFSSMKSDEFLTRAKRLEGYRFIIPAPIGTATITVAARSVTEARRAPELRGLSRARYTGLACARLT